MWSTLKADNLLDSRWSLTVMSSALVRQRNSADEALFFYNQLRKTVVPGEPDFLTALATADSQKMLERILATGPYTILSYIKQGFSPSEAKSRAFAAAASAFADEVLKGGRTITGDSIAQDSVALGYGRLPKLNACAFCVMLASRGAVYSKNTVLKTTGRARFGAGKAYHTNCACTMYPVFDREQKIPLATMSAEQEWLNHTTDVPTRDQLKTFRAATGRR